MAERHNYKARLTQVNSCVVNTFYSLASNNLGQRGIFAQIHLSCVELKLKIGTDIDDISYFGK